VRNKKRRSRRVCAVLFGGRTRETFPEGESPPARKRFRSFSGAGKEGSGERGGYRLVLYLFKTFGGKLVTKNGGTPWLLRELSPRKNHQGEAEGTGKERRRVLGQADPPRARGDGEPANSRNLHLRGLSECCEESSLTCG